MSGARLNERPKNFEQHQRWTEGKDDDSIFQFKQRERRKDLQEIVKTIYSTNLYIYMYIYIYI